jgi:NAD-dependent DNA ligase
MEQRLALLRQGGFLYSALFSHPVADAQQVEQWRQRWFTSPLPFATDGVVVRREKSPRALLGSGSGRLGYRLEISAGLAGYGGSRYQL